VATIVLAAAVPGSFWGAAVGWQMAAYAAAAVADQYINRVLFPPPKPKSRLGDIHLQTAEAGAAMAMLMGPEVRLGGEVIWKSAVREVELSPGGGCGGPSVPSQYGYYADVAIALGQPPPGGVVDSLTKVWFDGRVAYSSDPDVEYTSSVLSCLVNLLAEATSPIDSVYQANVTQVGVSVRYSLGPFYQGGLGPSGPLERSVLIQNVGGTTFANGTWNVIDPSMGGGSGQSFILEGVTWGGGTYTPFSGTATKQRKTQKIQSPNGGPNLSLFQAGYDVEVSGFSNAANNGTFECLSSGIDTTTGISWVILDNILVVAEAAGNSIHVLQVLPTNNPRHFAGVEFYDGSQWQRPNSTIEAVVGAGKTPAHVGTSWYLIRDLNLTLFGDRIPNINALVKVSTTWTVGQSIAALLERAGFTSDEYDVSTLTMSMRGYYVLGPTSTQSCLAAIMMTFDIVPYEEDGRLVFVQHKNIAATVIGSDELAAHEYGSDTPRLFSIRPAPERSVPTEIQVHYFNPAKDWQGDMEPARRTGSFADNVAPFESGIVMSPGSAQDLARRLLWTGVANQDVLSVKLPPSRALLREGSVVQVTGHGRTWNVMANKVDYAHSGVVSIEGPNDEAAALDFSGSTADGGADDSGGPGVLAALDLVVIDVAPLSDSQVSEPGLYVAAAPTAQSGTWIGAALYESADPDDGTFTLATALDSSANIGIAPSALGGGVSAYMIDRTNSLDVSITFGPSPVTVTEEKMLKGSNRLWYGGEIIGFATATLVDAGTNTYRLTNLLRGLRDTEGKIDTHQANEKVVFISSTGAGLKFIPQSIALLSSDRYYRAVVDSGVVDDYPTVGEFYDANTVRPFMVYDVRATRDPNDATPDVVVTWRRQTRANVHPMYPNAAPLLESSERYEIDLMDTTGINVSVTHTSTTTTTTFTTAEVVAAGYSALASISVRVYQIGDFVGRGRERRATV